MRAGYLLVILLFVVHTARRVRDRFADLRRGYAGHGKLIAAKLLFRCHEPCYVMYLEVTYIPKLMTEYVARSMYVPKALAREPLALGGIIREVSSEMIDSRLGKCLYITLVPAVSVKRSHRVADAAALFGVSSKQLESCLDMFKHRIYLKLYQKGYIPKSAFEWN